MITTELILDLKSPKEFHKFLQKEFYETFLLDLMNRFDTFNHDIEKIDQQSCGQYDFYSKSTGEHFEATLLISPDIVKELFQNPKIWLEDNFSQWIYNNAKNNVIQSLEKKKNKSTIILFNIFPMRNPRFSAGIFTQFASDGWDIILTEIINSHRELIMNKTIYLISYNHEDNFLLKQLYPRVLHNEFKPFYDKDDIFPIRVISITIK